MLQLCTNTANFLWFQIINGGPVLLDQFWPTGITDAQMLFSQTY